MSERRPSDEILKLGGTKFRHWNWVGQIVGQILMALLLIAALIGLFGSGPLSSATASSDGTLMQVLYDRFARYEGQSTLRIELAPGATSSDSVEIQISRSLLEDFQIESIAPEPDSVTAGSGQLTYTFEVDEPGQSAELVFHLRPQQIGLSTVEVGLGDDEPVSFTQFVYP